MSTYTALTDKLYDISVVANALYPTMPIIFSHQKEEEVGESYMSIGVLDIRQIGHGSTPSLLNLEGNLDIRVVYESRVQFSFYGSLSGDAVHSFYERINNNPLTSEIMSKEKVSVMRKSLVRRLPQKRDTQWVESFNFDVTFNYITNTTQQIDPVEIVVLEMSGETFTVPPDAVINP